MALEQYTEWLPAIERIAGDGGTAMLLGGVDTGKTTFCTLAVNAAIERGKRVAVVDADIGQSEIGPPACVGYGTAAEPIRNLAEVPASGHVFVGETAPRGNLLEHAAAVRLAADLLRSLQPDVTLIDTTGFIHGPGARRLKQAKMALLGPRHVVVLQRKDECESLLGMLRYREDIEVHRLPVPSVVVSKSPAFRAQRRASRFARAFEDAEMRYYAFENVALTGTWLNDAAPLAPHLLKFISNSLRVRVFHAEQRDRHLGIVTNAMPTGDSGLALVQEQFRAHAITITPASRLRHLLVGLCDGNNRMLGMGLIEAVDFRRTELGIFTPIRAHAGVRIIQFGLLRVESTGKELGTNRPGEV